MASEPGNPYRLISLSAEDDEELVVHAGSGRFAALGPEAAPDAPVPTPTPGSAPAAPAGAGREQLRQRAEELARAEENLENPRIFQNMNRIVVLAAVLVVLAFIGYLLLARG